MSAGVMSGSPLTEQGVFTEHTIESAPPAARRFLTATRDHLGYLPAGMARMAASPQIIDGFLKLTAIFERTALEPVAREVVVMTVATRNRCHICVAMHTARLAALGAEPGLIAALRDPDRAEPLPDERLDAIRVFTLRVLDTAGDVGDQALRDFLAAGYTTQNALEVVLGIGTYTMSTLANRLTGAPVDDQLAAYAWALSCSMAQIDGDGRVSLRPPGPGDQDDFIALARASAGLHDRWYSMPATREDFQAYLAKLSQPATEGFLVCLRDGGALAGVITIDSIIRGRFQSASLSYAAFAPAAGRGYMSEGLGLALRYAFCELRLHRLEANIQPANQASLRLVGRLGFRKEGYAPAMLFIDGAWRDHERWAITREMTDFPPVDPHPTLPAR
jgi:ribosomal-protein-alanine N-acetyltransferase